MQVLKLSRDSRLPLLNLSIDVILGLPHKPNPSGFTGPLNPNFLDQLLHLLHKNLLCGVDPRPGFLRIEKLFNRYRFENLVDICFVLLSLIRDNFRDIPTGIVEFFL
jgi:hypothetical protein